MLSQYSSITTGPKCYRYTDFLVNEILPSGQVVHLDNLKASRPAKKEELPHAGVKSGPTDRGPNGAQGLFDTDGLSKQQNPEAGAFSKDSNDDEIPRPLAGQNEPGADTEPRTASAESPIMPQTEGAPSKATELDVPPPAPSTPHSPKDEPKKLAPHLRVPPPPPYVPLSMQDLNGTDLPDKTEQRKRKKETVLIRQTAEGWVEVDEAKEKKIKEKATEDDAVGTNPEPNSTEQPVGQELKIEETEAMAPPPAPSTQTQWQAFGGPPTAEFRVSRCPC